MKKVPYIIGCNGTTRRWSLTVYEAKRGRRHFLTKQWEWSSSGCKYNVFFVIRQILTFLDGNIY